MISLVRAMPLVWDRQAFGVAEGLLAIMLRFNEFSVRLRLLQVERLPKPDSAALQLIAAAAASSGRVGTGPGGTSSSSSGGSGSGAQSSCFAQGTLPEEGGSSSNGDSAEPQSAAAVVPKGCEKELGSTTSSNAAEGNGTPATAEGSSRGNGGKCIEEPARAASSCSKAGASSTNSSSTSPATSYVEGGSDGGTAAGLPSPPGSSSSFTGRMVQQVTRAAVGAVASLAGQRRPATPPQSLEAAPAEPKGLMPLAEQQQRDDVGHLTAEPEAERSVAGSAGAEWQGKAPAEPAGDDSALRAGSNGSPGGSNALTTAVAKQLDSPPSLTPPGERCDGRAQAVPWTAVTACGALSACAT